MPERMIKFSVCAWELSPDVREALAASRAAAAAGVLLSMRQPGLELAKLSQSGRRELLGLLERQSLRLAGVVVQLAADALEQRGDADAAIAQARQAMESARALRCDLTVLRLGRVPRRMPDDANRPQPTEVGRAGAIVTPSSAELELLGLAARATGGRAAPVNPGDVQRCHAVLDQLARDADRLGVRAALGSTLSSHEALCAAMGRIDCPALLYEIDTLHELREGCTFSGAVDACQARVGHVRFRDGIGGDAGRVQPCVIGAGEVRLAEVLSVLREADYRGWLTVDGEGLLNPGAGVREGLTASRALLA